MQLVSSWDILLFMEPMGDTQIQYSFLLEGHEQRHAYKQLGFRVVPVPEAREVTRHWSALGKCISAGNTVGSRIIENDKFI